MFTRTALSEANLHTPAFKRAGLNKNRGVSMIELIVSLTIVGIVLGIAMPGFVNWLGDRQIQAVGSSIVDGMHLARSKAIERNTSVNFVLTALPGAAWTVKCPTTTSNCSAGDPSSSYIEKMPTSEGGNNVVVTLTNVTMASPPTFTFNGLGQLTSPTPPGSGLPVLTLTTPSAGACKAAGGQSTCLNIVISASGKVRYCDPSLAAGNSRGC